MIKTKAIRATLNLILLFLFNTLTIQAQSSFDGVVLYYDANQNLAIWTEIISKTETKIRVGEVTGKVSYEKTIATCGCKDFYTRTIRPQNNSLLFSFWNNPDKCKDKNIKYTNGFLIIDIASKKVEVEKMLNGGYSGRLNYYWFPDNERLIVESIPSSDEDKSVFLVDGKSKSIVAEWTNDVSVKGPFNTDFIVSKRIWNMKKQEYEFELSLVNVVTGKSVNIDLKGYKDYYLSSAFTANGERYVWLKKDDKEVRVSIDPLTGELKKEKADVEKEEPKYIFPKVELAAEYINPFAKGWNISCHLKDKPFEERLQFAEDLYKRSFVNNETQLSKATLQQISQLYSENPSNSQVNLLFFQCLQQINDVEELVAFVHPFLKSNDFKPENWDFVKERIKRKMSKTVKFSDDSKKKITEFFEYGKNRKDQNPARKIAAEYNYELWRYFIQDANKFELFVQAESLSANGNTSAYLKFLNEMNDVPKILVGSVHHAYAESVRESASVTNSWQLGDSILKIYHAALDCGFNFDGVYVGLVKTQLYFKNDFQKADSIMNIFKKLYEGYEKADVWIENYPFNAGIQTFKLGDYPKTKNYLTTYLKKGKDFEFDANVRLFEVAYKLKDVVLYNSSLNWLDKNEDKSIISAYFPNYDSLKSQPTSFVFPIRSNVLLIENLSKEFNALKALKNFNLLSATRERMEKIAFIFDSIGQTKLAAQSWNSIGKLYYDLKKYDLALKHFKRCSDLSKGNFSCHKDYAVTLLDFGKIDEAQSFLFPYYEKHSNDLNLKKGMGLVTNEIAYKALKSNQVAKSIELYELSLKYDENPVTCLLLAYAYMMDGKTFRKDEFVAKAKAINPNILQDYPDFKKLLKL